MPRRPDVPCADCGRPMWRSRTSLPPGQARCRFCRFVRTHIPALCQGCGRVFVALGKVTKFCGTECATRREPTTCPTCGQGFAASRRQTYCSVDCKQRATARRRTAANRPTCRTCSNPVPVGARTYCTECRPVRIVRTCQRCDTVRSPGDRWVKYCTDCRDAAYLEAQRAYGQTRAIPRVSKACHRCRAAFDGYPAQRYCSARCAKAARRRRERHARRARLHGATAEAYSAADIYERDRWRCHICGRRCRPPGSGYHPRQATIDHLVPIADGGPDTPANVSTACHECNARRGTGGEVQLALIG